MLTMALILSPESLSWNGYVVVDSGVVAFMPEFLIIKTGSGQNGKKVEDTRRFPQE